MDIIFLLYQLILYLLYYDIHSIVDRRAIVKTIALMKSLFFTTKLLIGAGTVKSIISGDTIIIIGQPRNGGPPPEMQLTLSGIIAPRVARGPEGKVFIQFL